MAVDSRGYMQPTDVASGFTPKWKHFSPHDRIWVNNPLDHDVVFQVADEYNRPFKYRLQAHKVSELPGGAIATLGVKAIVDELIQNTKGDEMQMWSPAVRKKHEDSIILREKRSNVVTSADRPGEVDLSVKDTEVQAPAQKAPELPEAAFAGLNQRKATDEPQLDAMPQGLQNVISASLPANDAVIDVGE